MPVAMLNVQLNLQGQWALLVGGGDVALKRARTLQAAQLRLKVVAPQINAELQALCDQRWLRAFEASDLQGATLVVACTDKATVNDEVARLGRAAGLLVNHAGDAGQGNLRFPAVLERGGLTVSISSGQDLPMLSQALREKVSAAVPDSLPVQQWAAQRQAALQLSGPAREVALRDLKVTIRQAVGL